MGIINEIRFAFRALAKSAGFTSLSVVILGVGLAVTIFMAAAIKGMVFGKLPFDEGDRIMHMERNNLAQDIQSMEVTQMDFLDWREQQTSFEDIAGFYNGTVNISGSERPERFNGAFITPNGFPMLRVQPYLGRTLNAGDMALGAPDVVMIGYDMWRLRFNADPDIIGREVRVNSVPSEIVGVMPEGFSFPLNEEVWVPLKIDPATIEGRGDDLTTLEVYGRLRDGVSVSQARDELNAIAARLAVAYPVENEGVGAVLKPYEEEYEDEETKLILFTMFGFVWLVLLIACANVANLVMARAVTKRRELAIRSAIGASRWRLVTNVFAETLVIAALASMLGLVLAHWGVETITRVLIENDQAPLFWQDISIDAKVVAYALAAAFVAALLAGLLPALRASKVDLNSSLKDGGQGSSSSDVGTLSRVLVTGQIALTCVMLVAGGLMTRSLMGMGDVDIGTETDNVLVGRVGLMMTSYPEEAQWPQFFEELVRRLEADPNVISATASGALPAAYDYGTWYYVEGTEPADGRPPVANYNISDANFFDTFGVNLISGRLFNTGDTIDSEPVIVITDWSAQRLFPGEDPIGHRIKLDRHDGDTEFRTIIGVVSHIHMDDLDDEIRETFFVPVQQMPQRFMFAAVRTRGAPLSFSGQLRDTVLSLDQDIPVYWLDTLDRRIELDIFGQRIMAALYSIFAAIALVLAAGGTYAVLAYSVSQRTQEIGVRRALGAPDQGVVRMVLRDGMRQLAIGLGIGLVMAAIAAQFLESELVGISAYDPLTFIGVVLLLGLVTLAATFIPTRRALAIHPMQALRYE